jgi:hypothetical protein
MASVASTATAGDSLCLLCCDELVLLAVGTCNHGICHVCAVRIRTLCGANHCPICRTELDDILITEDLNATFVVVFFFSRREKKKKKKERRKPHLHALSPPGMRRCPRPSCVLTRHRVRTFLLCAPRSKCGPSLLSRAQKPGVSLPTTLSLIFSATSAAPTSAFTALSLQTNYCV